MRKMISYNKLLKKRETDVMGFLNEIQLNYPNAISLASGRPDEAFFNLGNINAYLDTYTDYIYRKEGLDKETILNSLGQYNRTKGIINDLLLDYLNTDWNILARPEDIIVTVGAQEGMILSILAMCNKETDAIIVEDPSYIGISHFSELAGYNTVPTRVDGEGMCLTTLEKNIQQCIKNGQKVKLVYTIPDFQNPTGVRMPLKNRKKLLLLAEEYDFLIIEDNAYGDFVLDGERYPTIKSMDSKGNVIYLHSFSKLIYPSLRIGVVVADKVFSKGVALSDLMAKVKGYTTVNTPTITQAILGGMLVKYEFSLQAYNQAKKANLLAKRNKILSTLKKSFKKYNQTANQKISWNTPEGGYFMSLTLPFSISSEDVIECAREYGVIFTPMAFFYLEEGGEHQIRIAYSYVKIEQIEKAIEALAQFLMAKVKQATLRTQ